MAHHLDAEMRLFVVDQGVRGQAEEGRRLAPAEPGEELRGAPEVLPVVRTVEMVADEALDDAVVKDPEAVGRQRPAGGGDGPAGDDEGGDERPRGLGLARQLQQRALVLGAREPGEDVVVGPGEREGLRRAGAGRGSQGRASRAGMSDGKAKKGVRRLIGEGILAIRPVLSRR
ncbi:MAG: hypothetical protein WC969_11510 [Elusimicrobiota bacterium]